MPVWVTSLGKRCSLTNGEGPGESSRSKLGSLADIAPVAYDSEGHDNGYVRLAVALGDEPGAAAVVPVCIFFWSLPRP